MKDALLLLCLGSCLSMIETDTKGSVEIYPVSEADAAGRLELWANRQSVPLAARRVYHSDSSGREFMQLAVARFATDGAVNLRLKATHEALGQPVARLAGRDLAGSLAPDGALQFGLPGPGQYYVQLPALAASNCTFTLVLWVDDLGKLGKQRAGFETAGAVKVTNRNLHASPTLDQTAALQSLLDPGGTFVFPPGTSGCSAAKMDSTRMLRATCSLTARL
jgi:hypothetical protein